MATGRLGWLFVGFGLLDLYAFYRSFPILDKIFTQSEVSTWIPRVIPGLTVILIVSLLASGPLTVVGRSWGYVIYYFQFPLRIAFVTCLTFGFLFRWMPTQVGTMAHGMLTATAFGLEAVRLMLTIRKHRVLVSS